MKLVALVIGIRERKGSEGNRQGTGSAPNLAPECRYPFQYLISSIYDGSLQSDSVENNFRGATTDLRVCKSVVVRWSVFPPFTQKTHVQFPVAEFFFVWSVHG